MATTSTRSAVRIAPVTVHKRQGKLLFKNLSKFYSCPKATNQLNAPQIPNLRTFLFFPRTGLCRPRTAFALVPRAAAATATPVSISKDGKKIGLNQNHSRTNRNI